MEQQFRPVTRIANTLGATHYLMKLMENPPHVMAFYKADEQGEAVEVCRAWLGVNPADGKPRPLRDLFHEVDETSAGLKLGAPITCTLLKPILQGLAFRVRYEDITWSDEESDEPNIEADRLYDAFGCESFDDIIQIVKRYGSDEWSSIHPAPGDWLIGDQGTVDYGTGRHRSTSVHPLNKRSFRYLLKAAKAVGVK